jgi:hypothetical protein
MSNPFPYAIFKQTPEGVVLVTADGQSIVCAAQAVSPGDVTAVTGVAPITSTGGATPAIGITAATESAAGSMSAADKTKLDGITSNVSKPLVAATIQGDIYIDPQNVSGGANANGPGTITSPFQYFYQLASAWGTVSPLFNTTTTLHFLSNHTDDTDPVVWAPYYTGLTTTLGIEAATPTPLQTGTLSGVGAKSRAAGTNAALNATTPSSSAVGQKIANTTHASVAWIFQSVTEGNFLISQPMVASTIGGVFPAEVDTWANGDSVQLIAPVAVNLAYLAPVCLENTNAFRIYNITGYDPDGEGLSTCTLDCTNCEVVVTEVCFQRILLLKSNGIRPTFSNTLLEGGILGTGPAVYWGGGSPPATAGLFELGAGNGPVTFDADFIFGAVGQCLLQAGNFELCFVCLATTIVANGVQILADTFGAGGHVIYATSSLSTANIQLKQGSRFYLASGTFTNGVTAPNMVTAMSIDGGTTASSAASSGGVVTIHSGITTSVANLDASAGAAGFGGTAFTLGGSSISNVA